MPTAAYGDGRPYDPDWGHESLDACEVHWEDPRKAACLDCPAGMGRVSVAGEDGGCLKRTGPAERPMPQRSVV